MSEERHQWFRLGPFEDDSAEWWKMFDYRRFAGRVFKLSDVELPPVEPLTDNETRDTLIFFAAFVVVLLTLRFFLQNAILRPVGNLFGVEKVDKFATTAWELIYYSVVCLMGVYVYSNEEWTVWPTTQMFDGWPNHPFPLYYRFYYLFTLAFYTQALVALLFFDKKRHDFFEYALHHVVTIALIAGSYLTRNHRFGLLVLFTHDLGDVFLQIAKTFKYIGFERCTKIGFIMFTIAFFVTRLVALPFLIIPSAYYESGQLYPPLTGHFVMNCCMWSLQVLHLVWFGYLIQAINKASKGEFEDTRSEDGDDDDRDAKKKKKKKTN